MLRLSQTHSVRQDTGQVSKEALVDGKNTFCADGLEQAIKDALIQITSLIVHTSHDSVCRIGLAERRHLSN